MIVCGLPGAGKTTAAMGLQAEHGGVRFSADEWMQALAINLWDERARGRIEALQWTLAQQLLASGVSVIIEWGTWSRSERDALRVRARELGARAELHYVTAPVDVLFERVQRRRMEDPPMTRDHLEKWAELFEAPASEELALYD